MPLRDENGRVHYQFTLTPQSGVAATVAHGLPDPTADETEIEDLSSFLVGVDGNCIQSGNVAAVANSTYYVQVTATNIEIPATGGQSNVDGQTCHIYIIAKKQ
jgi:hypothetical protein